MDDRPLEIVAGGSAEDRAALAARKARHVKSGFLGCIIPLLLFAFLAIYCLGWVSGLNAS